MSILCYFLLSVLFLLLETAFKVFTDGSVICKAVYHYKDNTVIPISSAQITELYAVFEVLKQFADTTLTIYSHSNFVVHSVSFWETLGSFTSGNPTVPIFLQHVDAIRTCTKKFSLGLRRAHNNLPVPLFLGNAKANAATRNTFFVKLQEAQEAHKLHYLNSRALWLQFWLT